MLAGTTLRPYISFKMVYMLDSGVNQWVFVYPIPAWTEITPVLTDLIFPRFHPMNPIAILVFLELMDIDISSSVLAPFIFYLEVSQ